MVGGELKNKASCNEFFTTNPSPKAGAMENQITRALALLSERNVKKYVHYQIYLDNSMFKH
jgi:hypothetical protein